MRGILTRSRSPGDATPGDRDDLGEECEAFLAGRWVDHRVELGLPVPTWAWLNQAAHADEAVLRAAAEGSVRRTVSDGRDVQTLLAQALLAAATADGIDRTQRATLVPLELDLVGTVLSPRRLVELATVALFA